jgi:hypothetical protein
LGKETAKILKEREAAMDAGRLFIYKDPQQSKTSCVSCCRGPADVPFHAYVSRLASISPLCHALTTLYQSLKSSSVVSLNLNNHIDMSVILHSERFDKSKVSSHRARRGSAWDPNSDVGYSMEEDRPTRAGIAPWMTLLPLEDVSDMLDAVSRTDEMGLLTRFLELWTPTLT